jgi:excisionase family DNA binding protein
MSGELEKFYTPEQVAKSLGFNRRTILEMIKRHEIEAHMIVANRLRISETEIKRLLKQTRCGN